MVEPKADQVKDAGRVLMRYNDGRPALLGKQVGDGEVLFLTTAVDKDWGFFATNLTFQPFVHGAMTHLIERSAAGFNRVAGEPIRWTPKDVDKSYQVIRPDGTRNRLGKAAGRGQRAARPDRGGHQPGRRLHDLRGGGRGGDQVRRRSPTCAKARRWTRCPDAQIDELLGFKPEHLTTGGEAIGEGRVGPQPERVDGDGAVGPVACSRSARRRGRGSAGRRGKWSVGQHLRLSE